MATLITNQARAYVNYGRWIADCPMDCGGAMKMEPGQGAYHCQECGHLTTIEWPTNADEIWDALAQRPAPRNRNWFPSGHTLALRANAPHGQTVQELLDEHKEHTEE